MSHLVPVIPLTAAAVAIITWQLWQIYPDWFKAAGRQLLGLVVILPPLKPHPGHHGPASLTVGTSGGRTPARVESAAAAGTGPESDGARSSAVLSGTARNGVYLGTQPRLNKQPWSTSSQPALPAPPPKHAYDPGDGLVPLALVRPYMLPEYGMAPQLVVDAAQRLAEAYLP